MADFCKQCSISIFGSDTKDLAGITKEEDFKNDMAVSVICEGCGFIFVAPDGSCISKDCLMAGHEEPDKEVYNELEENIKQDMIDCTYEKDDEDIEL